MKRAPVLAPGTLLASRYRIEGELGRGGMGVVYRARQIGLDRPVAVKVMPPHRLDERTGRQRFEREARLASMVRHPNAVEVYDFGEDAGVLYLVMACVEGPTLRAVIDESGGLEPERTIDLATSLAAVLEAVHTVPIVHRDLKPANIFIEPLVGGGERPLVADFGLAFAVEVPALGPMTRSGEVAGSMAYMAPEQARGGEVGPPADVYALGCVIFEMLCGRGPFGGKGMAIVSGHLYTAPPLPSSLRPDVGVPATLDALVVEILRKSPADRPRAAEIRRRLGAIADAERSRAERRGASRLGSRSDRMVDAARAAPVARPVGDDDVIRLAVIGDLDEAELLPLLANRVDVTRLDAAADLAGESYDAVLVLDDDDAVIAAVAKAPLPPGVARIAGCPKGDVGAIARRARQGFGDVVATPLRIEDAVRQIRRACRAAKRRSK